VLLQGQLERLPRLAWTEAIILGWSLSRQPFQVILTFFSYPFHFHYLYIHFPIFIPNSIIFPIHPLAISRPTFHATLLFFHWSNISLSPSLTPLFPAYQYPTGTFVLNSPFQLSQFLCFAIHMFMHIQTALPGSHLVPPTPPSRTHPNISAMLTQLSHALVFLACAIFVYSDDKGSRSSKPPLHSYQTTWCHTTDSNPWCHCHVTIKSN
jgi:hypothetical protein